ncbi:MAG TPA: alternative ribosome rescue aminoacyl-tRNA hydrolase ArfB [Pirellulales bacterium]|jgi:ribosome-associated protein
MLVVSPRVRVPQSEFEFSYARSSGPGGQNVNKVNSKATLRWPVTRSPSLPEDVRQRFLARFGSRLTSEGELLVTSQRYRDQPRNIADCLEKLQAMLLAVATPPTPRRKTRPTRASGERRLQGKRATGEKKQNRRAPHGED